ncbi:MAG: ExbD/TolR family protein [Spirosomataceae bacterium]
MAAVKPKRHGPSMDMTAMCDVAFLLLTFFIMTTQFKSQESVTINTPSSISEELIEEKDLGMISVTGDGKYFFGVANPLERYALVAALNDEFGLNLSAAEQAKFTKLAEVGVSKGGLKQYLAMTEAEQSRVQLAGIPLDSANTELVDWINVYVRQVNPNAKLAIRGDMKTSYPAIKNLFDELGKADINKFKLVTKGE